MRCSGNLSALSRVNSEQSDCVSYLFLRSLSLIAEVSLVVAQRNHECLRYTLHAAARAHLPATFRCVPNLLHVRSRSSELQPLEFAIKPCKLVVVRSVEG